MGRGDGGGGAGSMHCRENKRELIVSRMGDNWTDAVQTPQVPSSWEHGVQVLVMERQAIQWREEPE